MLERKYNFDSIKGLNDSIVSSWVEEDKQEEINKYEI